MRALFLLPMLVVATPALAQYAPPQPSAPPPYGGTAVLPPQIMDPALPAELDRRAGAVAQAFMTLPVGELQAAIEGRPVTPADRRRTLGSEAGPHTAQDVQRNVALRADAIQSGARALQRAMPAIQQALGQVVAAIDRETANLPSPDYPKH